MEYIYNFAGLYSLSACGWLVISLIMAISVQSFIVRRYEVETDLLSTFWFSEHVNFTNNLPSIFSGPAYCAHLLSCTWFWRFTKDKVSFRDICTPQMVTQHFTGAEIKRVKFFFIGGAITVLHVFGFWIINLINPNMFG